MAHWRVQRALGVAVLLCAVASTARSQASSKAGATAGSGNGSNDALGAMQQSLEAQQVAIEAFRDEAASEWGREQGESIARQVGGLQGRGAAGLEKASAGVGEASTKGGQIKQTDGLAFFTFPWPGSLPLAMPNVQVAGEDCEALGKGEVDKLVESAAAKHGIAPQLLRSVMKQESAFKPCALSVAGAMGLMQIMPETAELLGLKDAFDPEQNVDAGAKFLKMMLERFGGDVAMALGAYNAGPEAVTKAGGVPPIQETLEYVSKILGEAPIAY